MTVQRVHNTIVNKSKLLNKKKECSHGPIQAMLAANNEPKSCPSVAPAPTNPNNLEPD